MFNKKLFWIVVIPVFFLFLGFLGVKLVNSPNHHTAAEDGKKEEEAKKELPIGNKKQKDIEKAAVELTANPDNNKISSFDKDISTNADELLEKMLDNLFLDMKDVKNGREQFKDNEICIEWEVRIRRKIGDSLSKEQERLMRENHLTALYIKDQSDLNYLENPEISHEEYKENLSSVFKWHQATYKEILSPEEYKRVFEVSMDETDSIIDSMIGAGPEIEITNPETTMDDVYDIVPAEKIEGITMLLKERQLGARSINEAVNSGEMSVEEAGEAWAGFYGDYENEVKELLEPEEYELIFGLSEKTRE